MSSLANFIRYHKTLSVYCIILLVSVSIFYCLPEYPGQEVGMPSLRWHARNDALDELTDLAVINRLELPLTDAIFTINNRIDLGYIYITNSGAKEGTVIITEYTSEFLAPRIKPMLVIPYPNSIWVHSPHRYRLNLHTFTEEWLRVHFHIGDYYLEYVSIQSIAKDAAVLYIQIPEGVEVILDHSTNHSGVVINSDLVDFSKGFKPRP